jgi:hypothetical protein
MAKKKRRQKTPVWYEPADPTPRHVCACCDFVTLPERGKYLICRVCFWEDDGQDLDAIDEQSGPNAGITLRQGRANFKKFGACDESMVEYVVSIADRKRYEYRPRTIDERAAPPRIGGK